MYLCVQEFAVKIERGFLMAVLVPFPLRVVHSSYFIVKSAFCNIDQQFTRIKIGLTEKKLKVKNRKNDTK